jgi:MFS family permease
MSSVIETDIPARLDRLPWCRFHTLVIASLGITWILDGLEVTLAGAVSGALQASPALRLSDAQIGAAASIYLAGAVLGAFFFGWLTDLLGRKKLFWITLGLYLAATGACALSPNFLWFAFFRFLTGAGIGGEYTAINSAIQELIPARYRGRTDLIVNGSFWIGAALGSIVSALLLRPGVLPEDMGWRACFGLGAILAIGILALRRHVPESPRWLMMRGRIPEAQSILETIESHAPRAPAGAPLAKVRLRVRIKAIGLLSLMRTLFRTYPRRAVLGLVLMTAQAFFYNAIFFTYALVLGRFFGIVPEHIGLFLLPFAAGNFLGPVLLGRLFDTVGRRPMIAGTYAISGVLLLVTALLFVNGVLDAVGQTIAWSVVFFFASAAASSAYLTVGESFPLEVRALAIALFYALGTGIGGIVGPVVFGALIGSGERSSIAWGYAFGAALMIIAAAVELWLGEASERKSLEHVARPLSTV